MKVCTMMEKKELPITMMDGLKIHLKVHVITRRLHLIRWSSQKFKIKTTNKKNADAFVQTFVDNKRKQLEKNLSAAQ